MSRRCVPKAIVYIENKLGKYVSYNLRSVCREELIQEGVHIRQSNRGLAPKIKLNH